MLVPLCMRCVEEILAGRLYPVVSAPNGEQIFKSGEARLDESEGVDVQGCHQKVWCVGIRLCKAYNRRPVSSFSGRFGVRKRKALRL